MSMVFVLRCDGRRQYIQQAVESAYTMLAHADFDDLFIVDDSGDPEYGEWLDWNFPDFKCVHHLERRGMAAGVQTALEVVGDAEYVFATEDDFVFTRTTNLEKMARILHCEPKLAQLSLKRQPVNSVEQAAGGFMQTSPGAFWDHSCESGNWVQHQTLFTFNPCLIPQRAVAAILDGTALNLLERGVTDSLLQQGFSFGVYGTIEDEPRVGHIGDVRSSGYRW